MAIENRVGLMGNLGADAELRRTNERGESVLNFRLATTERFKTRDGERKEHTEWHNCVIWGPRAEALAPHLTKGTKLVVEGKLRTRQYEHKDGSTRYTTDIHIDDVAFCGGGERPNMGAGDAKQQPRRQQQQQRKPKPKPDWADMGESDDNDFPENF